MSDDYRTSYRILNPYRDDMLVYLTDTELKELRKKRPEIIILKWHSPSVQEKKPSCFGKYNYDCKNCKDSPECAAELFGSDTVQKASLGAINDAKQEASK